jgi:N-formylglutamate deformylase
LNCLQYLSYIRSVTVKVSKLEGRWQFIKGDSNVIASAIHNGHHIRDNIIKYYAISEEDRLREEDPYTGPLTEITDSRIIVDSSRFEFDLNRSREKAIYMMPEDSWGLQVFRSSLPEKERDISLQYYDNFYNELKRYLDDVIKSHGRFVFLDIHSYNHRRNGPDMPPEPAEDNPEVNIGTAHVDKKWYNILNKFVYTLLDYNFQGRMLDVRKNIKFRGGYLGRWIMENYGEYGFTISIEFKKFFMDEWTDELYGDILEEIRNLLKETIPVLTGELKNIERS